MQGGKAKTELVNLGELLRAARQRRGLTLRELAEDDGVGVSSAFLSRVERNDALPSDELLLKLARKLEVDPQTALLHLFRDRASPEAREHLPAPAVLKLQDGAAAGSRHEGLEALAEPIGQILDVHRQALAENLRLSGENADLKREVHELSGAIAESNRAFLPEVNRFLISLINYESDLVRREAVVGRNGDATITLTLEGIRPKPDARPIRNLAHMVYIPQAVDSSSSISGGPVKFEVLEKPDDLAIDWRFHRESPERGAFLVNFPDGFAWRGKDARLSYRFSYHLRKSFVMTLEDAKATYGMRSLHDAPLEWSSIYINKPVRRLELSVAFPAGYAPAYIDKWVWWTETSFLECDYNLADKLLADREDGIEIEEGESTVVHLRARNPLLGFSYGIVWQPLSKRAFLSRIKE